MNKRLINLTILSVFALSILWFTKDNLTFSFGNRVDAAGAVTFNVGVPDGDPIFAFENIAPGFTESHVVAVANGDSAPRIAGIKGIKTEGMKNLEEVMNIVITENGTEIYGGASMTGEKTLKDFFEESNSLNGVMLTSISAGDQTEYELRVTFKEEAGNEYQQAQLTFDLRFGIVVDIPLECEDMNINNVIYGTAGNDRLNGTTKNDLIIGFEGGDRINGGVGNDCIVGGLVSSILDGGVGRDVIVGNDGDDRIDGGAGEDLIFGRAGNDNIRGGQANDVMYGGNGNDRIDGGAGADTAYGEDGNDSLFGGQGADILDGGNDIDSTDGQQGRDTCGAENKKRCEMEM